MIAIHAGGAAKAGPFGRVGMRVRACGAALVTACALILATPAFEAAPAKAQDIMGIGRALLGGGGGYYHGGYRSGRHGRSRQGGRSRSRDSDEKESSSSSEKSRTGDSKPRNGSESSSSSASSGSG